MNWGYRIILVFIAGAAFILYFVVRSFGVQTNMVEENYYAKELDFDNHIRATANLVEYPNAIALNADGDQVSLYLDTIFSKYMDSGNAHFYYPPDSREDKITRLSKTSDGNYLVNTSNWVSGNYILKLSFTSKGISYYKEESLFIQ